MTIQVIDLSGEEIDQVWMGENPENFWTCDDLIRLGDLKTLKVGEALVRYSNGTYIKK